MKFEKPKILLVDMPDDVFNMISDLGYNVSKGSFGKPYKVKISADYEPIIYCSSLGNIDNINEKEIVFINLKAEEPIEKPINKNYLRPLEETNLWAKCSWGKIDPRPLSMLYKSEGFDRILDYGGLFVIFAEPRKSYELVWGNHKYSSFQIEKNANMDNWSFLSFFNSGSIEIKSITGEEIVIPDNQHSLSDFFRKNFSDFRYTTSFNPVWLGNGKWKTILKNKFGDPIAAYIYFNNHKGKCLILPQMSKTPSQILTLVKEVLPEISPHLFPHYEGSKWIQRDEYEIPSIISFKKEIEKIKNRAQDEIVSVEKIITRERDKFDFLHNILIQGDDELVGSLINALHYIGFQKIEDVDSKEDEKNKQEDVQILDFSPKLLVEVKGLSSPPQESDVLQVVKYVRRRMKEWKITDISGVFVVNHQKNIPPLERNNISVFTEQQIKDAIANDILLITTWDLHLIIKAMMKWGWSFDNIKENFYTKGRFNIIPSHYKEIGQIQNYYNEINVISVKLLDTIDVNDRIGFFTHSGFLEEEVSSLQINTNPVESAEVDSIVGIKTCYSKSQLKKGMIVYKII